MMDGVESARNSEYKKVGNNKSLSNASCDHFGVPLSERQGVLTRAIKMTDTASDEMSNQERLLSTRYKN